VRARLEAHAAVRSRFGYRRLHILADTLADDRAFRTLNVVDDFTRECVAIEVDRSRPGDREQQSLRTPGPLATFPIVCCGNP
jgi:hypothetical protein